jgi:DNA mismatch repair ATPase MutL
LSKGIDDAYRGTVPAGRYPPVALRVEVDPRQVDVNVHPTKQLVRFSDEREVRLALSKAISHAIQGTGDSVPDQDERNTASETMDISSPPTSEGAANTPLAVPERPPMEDQLASETTSSVPLKEPTSDNGSDSVAPDRLFGASEKSPRSEPPKAPVLSEQHERVEQTSASLSG